MKGTQRRLECPKCGKAFFAWRPDELPGAPVKCYLCGTQFEDEAAKRKPPAPQAGAAPTPPAAGVPQAGAAPAATLSVASPPAEDASKPS